MTIKHIQARFTSGNDISIDKAVVPANEWRMAMAEIEHKAGLINALEAQVANQQMHLLRKDAELKRLRDETGQLQEQNRWLDEKLAEVEREAFAKAAQVCQDWIDDHSKADNCTYNDCDMVAAVTDVRTAILQLQHLNRGST